MVLHRQGRAVSSGSSDLVGAAPPICSDLLERACMIVLGTFTDDLVLTHGTG